MDDEIKIQAEAMIPTSRGTFNMIAFSAAADDWMPHFAMVHEHTDFNKPVLTRIHSECITGDLFGSKRCDCGPQLERSMEMASEEGGVILYLRQEGRGIGIINKLKAYQLQDKGLNTVEANVHLGLPIDAREYKSAITMLKYLGIYQIKLLTNNPEKIKILDNSGITLVRRVPLIIAPQEESRAYMETKQKEMGHLYDLLK